MLKLVAAKPDAVLIAASGTPAALPQKTLKERGYAGKYLPDARRRQQRLPARRRQGRRRHAAAGGPGAGRRAAAGQPPGEEVGDRLRRQLRGDYGKGSVSTFGAHAWDAGVLMQAAIPIALKKAQPGTPEFRARCATPSRA